VTIPNGFELVVVDSSGWVEFMAGGPKADAYGEYLQSTLNLLVPSIVVYEVYKKLFREEGRHLAEIFYSQVLGVSERLIPLDGDLSVLASRSSLELRLPMADAIIYATARRYEAQLITSDAHFASLPGVTIL
jgi:toxin FitB